MLPLSFFPSSFTENLKSYCSQLPTVIKQLTVISDVQLGATNFDSVSILWCFFNFICFPIFSVRALL